MRFLGKLTIFGGEEEPSLRVLSRHPGLDYRSNKGQIAPGYTGVLVRLITDAVTQIFLEFLGMQ